MNRKQLIREELKRARDALTRQRREEATVTLIRSLPPALASYSSVLSFSSLYPEIDTAHLNRFLAGKGKLLLPKVVGENLQIYRVDDLDQQLARGSFGLLEPIPERCEPCSNPEVVLVPALGFDSACNRIGYGKGFYDRLLSTLNCPSLGVGFKEQLVASLPVEAHDKRLKHLLLL